MIIKLILIIVGLAATVVGIVIARKSWRTIVDIEDAHLPYPHGVSRINKYSRDLGQALICMFAGVIVLIIGIAIK